MIKIRLDENSYINIQSYVPSFLKLGSGKDSYIVLGSKTLTAAFIKKYELEHVVSELMVGTTVVLPNVTAFREEALKELRQFRYDNLLELPDFESFRPRPKNSGKTLVNLEFGVVSLKLYEAGLLKKRVKKLLGELCLSSWFRVENYYYFKKGAIHQTAQLVWKRRFEEIGLSVNFKEVDKNLEVAVFTSTEISKNLITEEVSIEDHFGF